MDARVAPVRLLGLAEGDAHVIRNAGGAVTDDAIRSLAVSQHLLGTEEIVVIHHTDCGLLGASDEELVAMLERTAGRRPDWSPGAFADLDRHLRDSVEAIKASPFIPHTDSVRGLVYDVDSGELREVA